MRVLLCTDGLAGSDAATAWLERFGPAEPSALLIVAIAQSPPVSFARSRQLRALNDLIIARSRRACEAARARLEAGWADPSVRLMEGDAHEQVLKAAEEWRAELVVLGRAAISDDGSPLLGSVARMAARHVECSVLLVNRVPGAVRQIVLGMDGSAGAREAIRVLSLFRFNPTPQVLALGVVNSSWRQAIGDDEIPPPIRAALTDMETRQAAEARSMLARTTAGLAGHAIVEIVTPIGTPADVILRAARERAADLVAIGHQGVERVRRLPLGSVAERLLAAASCPILIGRK
jgi:nucleotide-binding universal stress UspA family protein